MDHFISTLEVGKVYDISDFYIEPNQIFNTVVLHRPMLTFNQRFAKIKEVCSNGPKYLLIGSMILLLVYFLFYLSTLSSVIKSASSLLTT